MTMTRNEATGNWEADLKDRMAGRIHLSLRTSVKREAAGSDTTRATGKPRPLALGGGNTR